MYTISPEAAGIGRRRQLDGEVEAVGEPGFGEQRLGLGGIVGVDPGQIDVGRVVGREMAADRRAGAREHGGVDGVAIEGGGDRPTDADVVEGLAAVVHRHDGLAFGAADLDRQLAVGLQFFDRLLGREVGQRVAITRTDAGELGLRVVDEAEGGAADLRRAAPPGVGGDQGEAVAAGPAVEAIGAGADRLGGVAGGGFLLDDHRVAPGEAVEEIGGRLLQGELHRLGVGRLDGADGGEDPLLGILGIGGDGALESEADIGRGERRAVVETGVLAQVEGVAEPVGADLPGFGEAGDDAAVAVEADEAFEDVGPRHLADRLGGAGGRVEHRRLQRHAQGDVGARRGARRDDGERQGGTDQTGEPERGGDRDRSSGPGHVASSTLRRFAVQFSMSTPSRVRGCGGHDLGGGHHVVDADRFVRLMGEIELARPVGDAGDAGGEAGDVLLIVGAGRGDVGRRPIEDPVDPVIEGADHRRVGLGHARGEAHQVADFVIEPGGPGLHPLQQLDHLAADLIGVFFDDPAAIEDEAAAVGDQRRRQTVAGRLRQTAMDRIEIEGGDAGALGDAGHAGAAALELRHQLALDQCEEIGHAADGADAEERHRTVADAALDRHFRPPDAAMAEADAVDVERFGDDDVVDAVEPAGAGEMGKTPPKPPDSSSTVPEISSVPG